MGQSFREIELMMVAERKYKVSAQMGNQGHSEANYFQFKSWADAGILENVRAITATTTRITPAWALRYRMACRPGA